MSDLAATVIEYLVVGDDEQTLVQTEVEQVILVEGKQGPPGPALGQGDLNMDNHSVLAMKTAGFSAELDNDNAGAFKQILFGNAQKQKVTLNQDCVLEISGAGAPVGHYQLRIVQNAFGGHDVVFQGLLPNRWLNTPVVPDVNKLAFGESILSLYWDGSQFTQSLAKVGAL